MKIEGLTAEEKCYVCKDLLSWAKTADTQVRYMEERIFAVRAGKDIVVLTHAESENAAYRKVLEPLEDRWIPVKFRELTDEEKQEYPDYVYMTDGRMPDDGQEILISLKCGRVEKDECGFDDGYYLDSGFDWETDVAAWMPLPEPYKKENDRA